jgi:hypothetical protein
VRTDILMFRVKRNRVNTRLMRKIEMIKGWYKWSYLQLFEEMCLALIKQFERNNSIRLPEARLSNKVVTRGSKSEILAIAGGKFSVNGNDEAKAETTKAEMSKVANVKAESNDINADTAQDVQRVNYDDAEFV